MEKIKRFFNQFRKQIIVAIMAIIFGILILQILNDMAKENNKNRQADIARTVDYGKDYTIISDEYKNQYTYERETNILKQFENYCNEKNYQQAYDLLTDECKQVLYPDLNTFIEIYCNSNFDRKKTCKFQAWNEQTYLVEIRIDAMSTGTYAENDYIQDYYTVVGNKLNISGYVKRKQVNKEQTSENITVKINYIDYFIDYTELNITTSNMNNERILLDTQEKENTIILQDENNVKYTSNVNEIARQNLIIEPSNLRKHTLRFQVGYKTDLKLEKLILSGILREGQSELNKIEINI